MLLISQGMLWCAVMVLAVAVLVLARQVGVLHERIAPVGALALGQGPQPGERAPALTEKSLAGTRWALEDATRPQLLFFVSPTCPVCKALIPTAKRVSEAEGVDLLFFGDGDQEQHRAMARAHNIPLERFVVSKEAGHAFRVGKLPYAVLLDDSGTVRAQGLVNTREHIESLFGPDELGFNTIQDFMSARAASADSLAKKAHNHG